MERDRLKRTLLQLMRVVLDLVLVNGGFSLFLFRIWVRGCAEGSYSTELHHGLQVGRA